MKEIEFIGLEMSMEHAAFQAFKHTNFKIGVIAPKFQMLQNARESLNLNVRSIDSGSICKLTETRFSLQNGSDIFLMTTTQNEPWRGMKFDMVFVLFEPLPHRMKLSLIPTLACNPNGILYTVYDR